MKVIHRAYKLVGESRQVFVFDKNCHRKMRLFLLKKSDRNGLKTHVGDGIIRVVKSQKTKEKSQKTKD